MLLVANVFRTYQYHLPLFGHHLVLQTCIVWNHESPEHVTTSMTDVNTDLESNWFHLRKVDQNQRLCIEMGWTPLYVKRALQQHCFTFKCSQVYKPASQNKCMLIAYFTHSVSTKSALFKELCSLLGIKNTHTTPYHPAAYSRCARMNRTILSGLKSRL